MRKQIGKFSQKIIDLLNLPVKAGTPIYIADTNETHMKNSHPSDYSKYFSDISNIIASPDYVGTNSADGSVEFVKEYLIDNAYVKVAVRVSSGNSYYARSLYTLNSNRVKNFINKGTLKKT